MSTPISVPMEVWNETIVDEKEQVVTIKNMAFKIKTFSTKTQKAGIRLPLIGNNELCEKFREYCEELKHTAGYTERERKYNLIRFPTFWSNDKTELKIFGTIGFYYLNDHVIFADEPNDLPPSKRLAIWVEYYKKFFSIEVQTDTSLFDVLDKLDMSDL